jgi:hypothetical protein
MTKGREDRKKIINSGADCGHLIQAQWLTSLPVVIQVVSANAWVWIQYILILESFYFPLCHQEVGPCSVMLGSRFARYDHCMGSEFKLDFKAV